MFRPYFFWKGDNVNEDMLRMYLRAINEKQNIIIEQLNSLSKVIANHLNLAIEEGECNLDEVEWFDN